MQPFVALLRGINVGGNNKVPMADLRALAEGLGWQDVQSLIASGNLVFRAEGAPVALAQALRGAMAGAMGVDAAVLVLPRDALRRALDECPFVPDRGAAVHVFFLFADPVVDWDACRSLRATDEELVVDGRCAWLHAPSGIGRSVLAAKLHKVLTGTDMTARNLNTVRRLVEMLDALADG
jgi:uncharacterized protein (DUF1697 family)